MRNVRALLVLTVALSPALLFAHARLDYPTPRSQSSGIKVGPCGSDPVTAPTVFAPGQQIDVTWVETIAHPGWYRIAFSPGSDQGFDQNVLADNIPNPSGLQNGDQVVTLPTTPCEGCSLQLVMHMTDKVPPSDYFSCADIAIRVPDAGMSGDAGTASDAGATNDAGEVVQDAGSSSDAGSPGDAATPLPDAGSGTGEDGGVATNDLGPVSTDLGCGASGAWTFVPLALAAALIVIARRRALRR